MVEIVVSVAAKVCEYLVAPVVHPLGYLFNYRTNLKELSQRVEKLRDAKARHQHSVNEAIGNGQKIEDDVRKWLTRADEFIEDACKFLEDEKKARKSCFNELRPNLKSRYQLSREARKKAVVAVEIHGDGQFERVSYRAPLQEIRSAPSEALQSRMLTLNEVMEALRDANINRIGVWGMGGVGKSTLVKQVAEQAEKEKLFDKVVTASVLQTPDFKRIQGELADMLGMKFEEESERGRAARLRQRMKEEKTIVVILDDIWAKLDLEKIGIPSPDDHKGRKLVLTSRNKHILSNEMGTQHDFPVEDLQEDEAWILFKNTAGDSIEKPDLLPIAIEVSNECAGLPIAIVTVATALKNKSLSIWKDALQQLKTQTSTNIPGMETKVYSSLKLSYDYLEGDEVKSFFLLCGSVFSSYIPISDSLKYGMGLRLFQGTNTLEEARNRIDTLVDHLKASNLLLDTGNRAILRMHDVVRNVALKIESKEHRVLRFQKGVRVEEWPKMDELQKFTVENVDYRDICELPEGLVSPKLELFVCDINHNSAVKIPNTFFEGMKQLKVLDFTSMQLTSLPSSLQCLANLRTLCLDGCKLGDIVIIAELKKLEILSLAYSDIEQFPREIAQLTHLRLFDLKGSSKLKVIPPDVISCLFRLEDLCMENSFTQWEGEGKSNACLAELKHLSHLTSLDIQIPDAKLLPKDIVFDNLVRYRIFVGDVWSWEEIFETNKTLKLNKFDTSLYLVDAISKLLKRTEDLHLRELCGGTNVLSKLNREGFLKLKHLNVESSPEIQYIVNSMDLTPSHGAFPVMETLSLKQLINLQEVCHGQFPAESLGCLRKVEVEDCDGLKFLFSLSVARGLSRLEEIKVTRCKSMVEMVEMVPEIKEDAVNVPLFPELRYLTLQDLPKLGSFWFEENPDLSMPVSAIVGPSTPPLNQPEIRDGQLLLSLGGNLRFLKLKNCMSLLKLFPPSLLQNLEVLLVENCDQLEQVFDLEGLNVDDIHVRLLPKLQVLGLTGLPKLRHICNCGRSTNHFPSSMASAPVGNIIFPKLIHVSLESLPTLTSFSPAYHSLQRLHHADFATPLAVLFDERVSFPSLESLNISGLDNVKKIWHNQLPQDSFSKLKELKVASCGELLNIFPSTSFMLKMLQSLQHLEAVDCSSLQEVFDVEGANVNVKEGVTITQLSQLILKSLPKVEKIWNKDPHGILTFQNLKSIMISECQNLKNLFPASLVQDLVQLEQLLVWSCGIEEIVAKDNGVEIAFVFPKVTSLTLGFLHQLRSFYPGAHTSKWPLLEKLLVVECHKLNVFAFEAPTFQQRRHEGNPDMPLFLLQQVSFLNLEELKLGHNRDTEIWQKQFPLDSLSKLKVLHACEYRDILVVIPSFMLQRLHNLEELIVSRCISVKEVFQFEGLEENQARRLGRLREIQLLNLPRLTHLWKENSKPGPDLQSLESLIVRNCDSLIKLVPSSVSFQNLATLEVQYSCGSLRSLISPSVAKTLVKLKTLKIGGSHMMEEVVANEGGEAADEIAFCKLQHLELVGLPNLTSFSSGGYIFSFPSLEHIVVKECPKMKIFSPVGNIIFPKLIHISLESLPTLTSFSPAYHSLQRHHHADLDTPFPALFDERVSFPSLESLNISGLDNVKKIWHNQLPQDSFSKLKELKVASCGELLNIFPSTSFMLKMLQSLQHLEAVDCSSLQEVFDVEGINVNVNGKEGVTVTQLSQLILKSLPKIEKIWNKDLHEILTFQNLKLITIKQCQSLKNLFPASLVTDLVQLEELEVVSCGIEEIVAKDNGVETTATFVFPKVTTLSLCYLHQLRSFYPGAHTSQWPLLEKMVVVECHKLNVFAFETPTFQQRHHDGNLDMPLFFLQHVAFRNLEELALGHNRDTEIWQQEQFPVDSFPKLRVLDVREYRDILVAIPSFLLQRLHNLEKLIVRGCSTVKEVFQLEGLDEENQDKRLGQLREIQLRDLPGLTHLWKENSKPGPDLLSLESLIVRNCDSLINLVPSSVSFQNLATLEVLYSCGSLRSLMSPSVAKTLVKLKTLKIGGSHMMEEVVANEGGEAADEIAFCKLQHMELVGLPNLTSFSSGGYIFSFPSLEHMVVKECPEMKIFSPVGNIIFPKLIHISLESLPTLTSFSPAYHSLQRYHHADLDTPFPALFDERVAFPSLELLNISGLDNVKTIWHNQLPQNSFSKLKELKVASCGELLNIFPSSMLKRLQNLQHLEAVDCSSLEEVFDVEGINVKEGVSVTQLSQLILKSLPKVEKIWSKDPHGILTFQNLKLITIKQCQRLKNLFPASLVRDLVQLEELEVWSCGIEEIVAKDNGVGTTPTFVFPRVDTLSLTDLHQLRSFYPGAHTSQWPWLAKLGVSGCDKVNVFAFETPTFQQRHHEGNLFLLQHVAFPNLEGLVLDTEISQEQFPVDSFPKLTVLFVCDNRDILVAIPSFLLPRLHNLEVLTVGRCSSVKEVFQLEGLDEENQAKRLGRLREIRLDDLPGLTHLWKENSKPGPDLQSLESLKVTNCDSLINLVPSSGSFQNLATLDVQSCGSLRSLISPSVAKTLVKLKTLKIGGSHMMEEVVANEGGEAADEIAFCKLQHMELVCFPNLTSFSPGGYIFSFPSLEHMVVKECPKMKIFSPGLITTPRLERVQVADDEWHWQDDLNTTIHNLFMKTIGNVGVEIVELGAGSAL